MGGVESSDVEVLNSGLKACRRSVNPVRACSWGRLPGVANSMVSGSLDVKGRSELRSGRGFESSGPGD